MYLGGVAFGLNNASALAQLHKWFLGLLSVEEKQDYLHASSGENMKSKVIEPEATKALELANSYIEEVEDVIEHIEGDYLKGHELLKTLDLAKRQVEIARKLDDNAKYNHDTTTQFLARILGNKGIVTLMAFKKRAAGLKSLEKSLELSQDLDPIQYAIGVIYAEMGNKVKSMIHLKKAIALAPENIEYRKLHDRIENTSTLRMKLGAFHGSWIILFGLLGLNTLFMFSIVSDGDTAGIPAVLFLLAVTLGYWKLKSR